MNFKLFAVVEKVEIRKVYLAKKSEIVLHWLYNCVRMRLKAHGGPQRESKLNTIIIPPQSDLSNSVSESPRTNRTSSSFFLILIYSLTRTLSNRSSPSDCNSERNLIFGSMGVNWKDQDNSAANSAPVCVDVAVVNHTQGMRVAFRINYLSVK